MARKAVLVKDVPQEIRDALLHDAREHNTSINEAAAAVLAAHYKIERQPSGVPFAATFDGSTSLMIRGGNRLHRAIDIDRARRGGTMRGVVLERLAIHYGLDPEPIGRRPRGTINA